MLNDAAICNAPGSLKRTTIVRVIYILAATKIYLMDLSEIVSITGMPGLFKVTTRRNDGLIVNSLVDDKTQFVPGRTHLFTTLDNITIYTKEDTSPLKEVLA